MIKADLWLYMELLTLTKVPRAHVIVVILQYDATASGACSNWVRGHNSMYSQRPALLLMTVPPGNKFSMFRNTLHYIMLFTTQFCTYICAYYLNILW